MDKFEELTILAGHENSNKIKSHLEKMAIQNKTARVKAYENAQIYIISYKRQNTLFQEISLLKNIVNNDSSNQTYISKLKELEEELLILSSKLINLDFPFI